ncbi:fibronectin type III domain-containing protein [Geomonas propionica]|uniref:Fibronectin type III domain-containing protein n=1 Tax=Geomonas propionica TaxID=2798582 RepID=A0ABS0YU04_9BACT|nr:fibronectin type III domain-containing protein [Geomonas propionica]MBJ6801448.1 fibronectin type III domain-containing protein [Geomonas propionica]
MGKNRNGGEKDEDIIRAAGDLLTSLSKDPSIMRSIYYLLPDQERMQAAHDQHRNLFHEVLGGAHDKEGELEAARNEVVRQMSMVHSMANLTGKHDPTIPQKLGMASTPSTPKRTSSPYPSTMTLKVVYQDNKLVARANGVKSVKSYDVWVCEGDPFVESSWRHHATSTRAKRIVLTGLTPGKMYYFRIRALTTHGEGPWSNFVNIMAI